MEGITMNGEEYNEEYKKVTHPDPVGEEGTDGILSCNNQKWWEHNKHRKKWWEQNKHIKKVWRIGV